MAKTGGLGQRQEELGMKLNGPFTSSGTCLGLAWAALLVVGVLPQAARGADRVVLCEEFTGWG